VCTACPAGSPPLKLLVSFFTLLCRRRENNAASERGRKA
jgi:hypothetical protein